MPAHRWADTGPPQPPRPFGKHQNNVPCEVSACYLAVTCRHTQQGRFLAATCGAVAGRLPVALRVGCGASSRSDAAEDVGKSRAPVSYYVSAFAPRAIAYVGSIWAFAVKHLPM